MMNDFTKEELYLIKKCIWLADAANGACRVGKVQELETKIQSLIDNYERDQKVKEAMNLIIEKAREWKIEL